MNHLQGVKQVLPDHPAIRVGAGAARIAFKVCVLTLTALLGVVLIVLATGMGTNGSGNRRSGW